MAAIPEPLSQIILIHTSVKFVTSIHRRCLGKSLILIHTSVKLVTILHFRDLDRNIILIHTSVKLVTIQAINRPEH